MLTLKLYKYNGKNNAVTKELNENTAKQVNGVMFNDFDIIRPSLKVRSKTNLQDIATFNYCLFNGKYYFVENITTLSADVYKIDLFIDVLTTYQNQIKAATATVINCTNSNAYISNRQTVTDIRPQFEKLQFSVTAPFIEYGDIVLTTVKGNV